MRKELKLGIFVITALIVSVFLIYASSINLKTNYYKNYTSTFYDIAGLKKGDSVMLSGVDVGSVDNVYLDDKNIAHADYSIKKDIVITKKSYVQVVPNNIIGNPILLLKINNLEPAPISNNIIPTIPSISISKSLQDISFVAESLKSTTESLKGGFSAIKKAPKETFDLLNDIITSVTKNIKDGL